MKYSLLQQVFNNTPVLDFLFEDCMSHKLYHLVLNNPDKWCCDYVYFFNQRGCEVISISDHYTKDHHVCSTPHIHILLKHKLPIHNFSRLIRQVHSNDYKNIRVVSVTHLINLLLYIERLLRTFDGFGPNDGHRVISRECWQTSSVYYVS